MSSSRAFRCRGTRIEPYSRSGGRVARSASAEHGDAAQQRGFIGTAVDHVEDDPGEHPAEPDVAGGFVHDHRRDPARGAGERSEHGQQRQVPAAQTHREGRAVGTVGLGLGVAHLHDRQVGDREREHRPEGVDADEEIEALGDDERRGEQSGQHDEHIRSRALVGAGDRGRWESGGWWRASRQAGRAPTSRSRRRRSA